MAATQEEEEEEAETQAEKVENENNAAAAAAAAIEIENLSKRGQRERECCVGGKKQTERKTCRDRERARRQAQKCRQQSSFFLGGDSLGGLAFWDVLKPRSSASPLLSLRLFSSLFFCCFYSYPFSCCRCCCCFYRWLPFYFVLSKKKVAHSLCLPLPSSSLGGAVGILRMYIKYIINKVRIRVCVCVRVRGVYRMTDAR